jgi:hypothetical protein
VGLLPDLDGIGWRLLVDLVAIAVLAVGLFWQRHRRRDLVALLVVFNIGLFAAVVVINEGEVAAAVGFGLFAVLSIIRLRAELLSYVEIAYFFAAIVLGLVSATELESLPATIALAVLVLAAPAVADHPLALRDNRLVVVTIERAIPDEAELRAEVEARLGREVVSLEVRDLDWVRDLTTVAVYALAPTGAATK